MPKRKPSPRGTTQVEIDGELYELRLGHEQLMDIDEYLGRSFLKAIGEDPSNTHLARVCFYFSVRERAKEIRSVKQAGKIMAKDFDAVSEALLEAGRAGGVFAGGADSDEDDEDGAEGNDPPS